MKRQQGILPFQLDVSDDDLDNVTAYAGLPLVIEALRAVISNKFYRRLRKALGYKFWHVVRRHVESLVLLFIAGGDHVDDIAMLRADKGLIRLLGFTPSSATQLKDLRYVHFSYGCFRLFRARCVSVDCGGIPPFTTRMR